MEVEKKGGGCGDLGNGGSGMRGIGEKCGGGLAEDREKRR